MLKCLMRAWRQHNRQRTYPLHQNELRLNSADLNEIGYGRLYGIGAVCGADAQGRPGQLQARIAMRSVGGGEIRSARIGCERQRTEDQRPKMAALRCHPT